MILPVLRVSSATLDVDALLAAHPDLAPVNVWRTGQTGPRGRVYDSSGFTLDLGSGAPWVPLLEKTLERLEAHRPMLDDARERGADLTLDFGLVVGIAEEFTETASFAPGHLRQLLDPGVTVLVSAYPGQE